ncbi:hypothetical protein [Paraburkholderia piptadeniae]|nr:hypothetical protein [Paraburkholderia piptadeniae]
MTAPQLTANLSVGFASTEYILPLALYPQQSATCIFQLHDGQQVIVSVPLSAAELQAYRRHPATFFERIEPSAGQTIETPFKTFMWLLEAHKNATRAIAREYGRLAQFRRP